MKSILYVVLLISAISAQADIVANLAEFENGEVRTFSTRGHKKAKGVILSIKYPKSWQALESKDPDVVQRFKTDDGQVGASITIEELPADAGAKPSAAYVARFSTPEFLRNSVPEDGQVREAKTIHVEGKPAGLLEFRKRYAHDSGKLVDLNVVMLWLCRGRALIGVKYTIGSLSTESADLSAQAAVVRPLFDRMTESIRINEVIHK